MNKSDLLFEFSKYFYSIGDLDVAKNLVRNSIYMNPSNSLSKLKWYKDTLESKGFIYKVKDKIAGYSDSELKAINALKSFDGFSDDRYIKFTYLSPHCAYRPRENDKKRALIINDTSRMPYNKFHPGCFIVCDNLYDKLESNNIEVAGWINELSSLSALLRFDQSLDFDCVILNGEGTMHDDAARAHDLLFLTDFFKSKGKKTFLINSIWENNSTFLNKYLSGFDIVSLRESKSYQESLNFSDSRIVPDLTWSTDLFSSQEPEYDLSIHDSVLDDTSKSLSLLANNNNIDYYVMHKFYLNLRDSYVASMKIMPKILYPHMINNYKGCITGRFHGALLSLNAAKPVVAISSNTKKIESTLVDIGLVNKVTDVNSLSNLGDLSFESVFLSGSRFLYTEDDWRKVSRYKNEAVTLIDKLFLDISALVH